MYKSIKPLPGQVTVGLDAVLHAVEFPAGVAHLDSGLADVDADAFSHDEGWSYSYWEAGREMTREFNTFYKEK